MAVVATDPQLCHTVIVLQHCPATELQLQQALGRQEITRTMTEPANATVIMEVILITWWSAQTVLLKQARTQLRKCNDRLD